MNDDLAAWIRAREVCYEAGALVERVQGRQVQVGFTLRLSAHLSLDKPPGPERHAEAAEIREHLRQIVDSLVLPEDSRAQVEIEAPRAFVAFEPGSAEPDVVLNARVFHRGDYFAEATLEEENRLRQVAGRLTEWGLQERRPALRR